MTTPHTATALVFVTFTRTFELEVPVDIDEDNDVYAAHLYSAEVVRGLTEAEIGEMCVRMKVTQREDLFAHVDALVQVDKANNTPHVLVWTCASVGFTQLTADVCDRILALLLDLGCEAHDNWNGYGCSTFSTRHQPTLDEAQLTKIRAEILKREIRGQLVRNG